MSRNPSFDRDFAESERALREASNSLALARLNLDILKCHLILTGTRLDSLGCDSAERRETVALDPGDAATVDRLLMAYYAASPTERPDGSIRCMQAALRSLRTLGGDR